ncbi:MAG: class I SAM-dependent methyltransferase [Myxococcaceae bacterium]
MGRESQSLCALALACALAAGPGEAGPNQPALFPGPPTASDAGTLPKAEPRTPARPMGVKAASWLTRPEREVQEQPERMLDALGLSPGQTVADVGAGVGYHAWRLAARVGPSGRVYATDLQPEMLALLRATMAQRDVHNVLPILATTDSTGLPDASVDLALLVDVYHEAADPQAFLRQLRRALKASGRLVLVEFRAEDPSVPIRSEHKMAADQVIAELALGGFQLTERQEFLPWQHLLVFVPVR